MTPCLETVKKASPEIRVSVLLESPYHELFEGHPNVDELWVLPRRSWYGKLSLIRDLHARRYDAVVNLHGGTTSALLAASARTGCRVGFSHFRFAGLYDRRVDPAEVWGRRRMHTVECQLAALAGLGIPVPERAELRISVSSEARQRVGERLAQQGITSPYLHVHPAATLFTKQWAGEKFAALLDHLAGMGWPVVMTTGAEERAFGEGIANLQRSPVPYFFDLSLSELAALIGGCSLFVGCDSGPAHLAAALGRKMVVVFGSSDSDAWHPWGVDHSLLRSELPCIPCPGYRCAVYGHPRCIEEIPVERVRQAVESLLGDVSRRGVRVQHESR